MSWKIPRSHEVPDLFLISPELFVDPDGKTNWTMVREAAAGAGAGVVAAGRRLHLHLQDREASPKREAGGAEAVTLTAECLFQRRAIPCPAAALTAAILPISPTPARTGDSHQGAARYACTETGSVRQTRKPSYDFHVHIQVHLTSSFSRLPCSVMF